MMVGLASPTIMLLGPKLFVSVHRPPCAVKPSEDVNTATVECHTNVTTASGHLLNQIPFIVFGIVYLDSPAAAAKRVRATTEDVEFPIQRNHTGGIRSGHG